MSFNKNNNKNNLLVISHAYTSFQKDQIESVAPYFSSVNVLVRINPIADIGEYLSIQQLVQFSSRNRIDKSCIPDNVNVYSTPIWYLPLDKSYKNLGDKHLSHVVAQIQKHGITFNLIHSHFTWTAGYVGARLKERYSVPLVVTAHGFDIYSLPFKDTIWRRNIQDTLNTADAIITVSQNNNECIKKMDVTTPVHVIPNGFREDLFYPRDSSICRYILNLPQDKKILLTVGSLVDVKGLKYLVEAISEIIKEKKDIFCIIVGWGNLLRILRKQIHSLGLDDFVLLTGGKPHHDIPLWINACDVFVLPSLFEGNPTVMFEALACGKPFIGTRVGGIPEVIISEEYGLLVSPKDPHDLAEKIIVALDREWDREKISAYAGRYTWENIAEETMDVYKKVLG